MTHSYTKSGQSAGPGGPIGLQRLLGPALLGLLLASPVAAARPAGAGPGNEAAIAIPQLVRPGGVDYAARGLGHVAADRDVIDAIASDRRLGAFVTALQITGLTDLLRDVDSVVIFAPTDEAFGRLSDAERRSLFSDRGSLMRLLARHIRLDVSGTRSPKSGTPVGISEDATVNVVALERRARNGVIHIIDRLI